MATEQSDSCLLIIWRRRNRLQENTASTADRKQQQMLFPYLDKACFRKSNILIDITLSSDVFNPSYLFSLVLQARTTQLQYLEEIVVEIQGTHAAVESKLALLSSAGRRKDTDCDIVFRDGLYHVKLSYSPRKQISAHLWRHFKGNLLLAAGKVQRLNLGHVGDCREVRRDDDGDSEGGFDGWFVPARKSSDVESRKKI